MTKKAPLLTAFAAALTFGTLASVAQAAEMDLSACAFADEPTIADGTSASQEAMTESASAVRGYMGAMQDALACLEQAEKDLGAEITPEQRQTFTSTYNSGVDKLEAVAARYNEQVRAFKNR